MRGKPFAPALRVLTHALAIAVAAFSLQATVISASAEELDASLVVPVAFSPTLETKREEFLASTQPQLTNEFLQAYVDRQRQLEKFDGFTVAAPQAELTEAVLMGYIARRQNQALDAIESADLSNQPVVLTASLLTDYAKQEFVPTTKRVKLADDERLCLTQAI